VKETLREKALALEFDACRFTSADRPQHAAQFEHWLADGRHGQMEYLHRNAPKRVAPDKVLPGARSIITLATSYHRPLSANEELDRHPGVRRAVPRGFVARYARFADYHQVIAERLAQLSDFLNQASRADARSLWYVDTGPLLERDLAERAGLGFIGKHTNLISRSLGNWIFLSEIITTVEFPPDDPEHNRCGSCTRCISACPTAAIRAPFELDARRCISYLTIELKGSIPLEFRRALGNRIYGCDDCLAVCSWNRFAREGALMKEHFKSEMDQPALLDLLSLDDAGFKHRFAGSPMLRTKRRGLLRNVCVALGNIGDNTALPALQRALLDSEPLIREHAEWAIDEIQRREQSARPATVTAAE